MAKQSEEMRFSYQPVIDRATRVTTCVEALVHQEGPDGEMIPYRQISNDAMADDQLFARTDFVLNHVLSDLPRLKRMFGADCGVSVGLSTAELLDSTRLVPLVLAALATNHAPRADLHICAALDPTTPLSQPVIHTLETLRTEHISVVLDKCGTGVTHRSYGKVFCDIVKLDKSAVQRMLAHAPTRSLVAAIATFCESAGVALVADGVDDAMILNELEPLPCTYVQGALFGDPVEIDTPLPRVFSTLHAVDPQPEETENVEEQLDELRTLTDELDPRAFELEFPEFLARAQAIRAELALLHARSARELSCILGQKVTVAAVYASEKITSLDWGLETSNLAEDLGQFEVSAQMLALISTLPVSTESSRFVRVEALSRALQIRATTELDPQASGMLDNSLAMALAHMGLTDRATAWWKNIVRTHEDLDLPGHTYAAVNLAEIELAMLEDPEYDGSDVARQTSLHRIARATARLARSQAATPGLSEALQARLAVATGDIDGGFQHLGPWLTAEPQGIVPIFIVGRARAVLARSIGDTDGFLHQTTLLVERAAPSEILRHHRTQIMILHIDALIKSGRIKEALSTQRELIDYEIELGKQRASAMFDWMQIRADVDLQFAHYADVARVPEAATS